MRQSVFMLTVILLAGCVVMFLDVSRPQWRIGPARAFADDIQVSMPNEVVGFNGTLVGKVVSPVGNTWFKIQVIRVVNFAPGNKNKLSVDALTAAWKDKYVAVRGVKDMPDIKVGDTVTITAAQFEMHIRSTKVVLGEPAAPPPPATKPSPPVINSPPPPAPRPIPAPVDPPAATQATATDPAADKLRLAQLFLDNGMKSRAKETLQNVITQYPDSEAAQTAKARLAQIGD